MNTGLRRELLRSARATLQSAWNDYYTGDYTWTVLKAHHAASMALWSATSVGTPPPLAAATLDRETGYSTARNILFLDHLARALRDPYIATIIGWHNLEPLRAEALRGLEAAVSAVSAAAELEEPIPPRPEPYTSLEEYARRHRGLLLLAPDNILVLVVEDATGLRYPERPDKLNPPPAPLIILAPDEALALAELAPLIQEAEPLVDEIGLAHLIHRR